MVGREDALPRRREPCCPGGRRHRRPAAHGATRGEADTLSPSRSGRTTPRSRCDQREASTRSRFGVRPRTARTFAVSYAGSAVSYAGSGVADAPVRVRGDKCRRIGRLAVSQNEQEAEHAPTLPRSSCRVEMAPRAMGSKPPRPNGWVASGPSARAAEKGVSYIRGGARVARGSAATLLQRRAALGREGSAALALAPS